jgi:hypothetical protein
MRPSVFSKLKIGDEGEGSPIALSITHMCLAIGMLLFARFTKANESYVGFELHQVLDIRKLWASAKLGASGVFMICSEWSVLV